MRVLLVAVFDPSVWYDVPIAPARGLLLRRPFFAYYDAACEQTAQAHCSIGRAYERLQTDVAGKKRSRDTGHMRPPHAIATTTGRVMLRLRLHQRSLLRRFRVCTCVCVRVCVRARVCAAFQSSVLEAEICSARASHSAYRMWIKSLLDQANLQFRRSALQQTQLQLQASS